MTDWLLSWTGISPVNSMKQLEKDLIHIAAYGSFIHFFRSKRAYEVPFRLITEQLQMQEQLRYH